MLPGQGGSDSIPGQGTRSHMPQLKILCAITKTQHSQINKIILKKKRVGNCKGGRDGGESACWERGWLSFSDHVIHGEGA